MIDIFKLTTRVPFGIYIKAKPIKLSNERRGGSIFFKKPIFRVSVKEKSK